MNPKVDAHIARSEQWPGEMTELREVLLSAGLAEEYKWGKPCYAHDGANIAIVQQMKDFLALMFFKGALLADPAGVLREQGPNSRSARRIEFTSVEEVRDLADTIRDYVGEAVAVEEQGLTVPKEELVLVDELQRRLDGDPELRAAFDALTPGRQREYHLHVSGAKRAETRENRVEQAVPLILAGKGLRD